jgi:hypothetical protein
MSQALKDVIENTKEISVSDSALDTLLDFERVISELDTYVFANWKMGELVAGPVHEKYFVTCTFMWPYKKMPDPRGGERLLDYGCEISYRNDFLEYPVKIKDYDDFEAGGKMPKMKKVKVWLVEIVMPKQLMSEIKQGSVELEGEKLDIDEIETAYEEGMDEDELQGDTASEDTGNEGAAPGAAPAGMPPAPQQQMPGGM